MKVESSHWTGQITGLSLCYDSSPPYIISCYLQPEGSADKTLTYFSIDEEITVPIAETEVLKRWILPRLPSK